MHTLGTHFTELLKNLRPPQERLDAAKDLPPLVRQYLAQHKEFKTVYPPTRLAGSYAQDMCVSDVKDVDFLVSVPGDPKKNEPEAKGVVRDLCCALEDLPEALGYTGFASTDNLEVERARRSVHVYFVGHDFHLDVVPCIAPDGFEGVIYVPDRGFNQWIKSHPIGYVNLIRDLDRAHGGKVRGLGKLLKHFRNVHMKTRRPKSYWLGALMIHHVRRAGGLNMSQPLAALFLDLLDAIYEQYDHLLNTSDTATPNIEDPMLGHNISWNWERSHFETFMRRIEDGRRWAEIALADDTDCETAIKYWQKIFGTDYFPSDVQEASARLAGTGLPGHSFISGTGLVMPSKPSGVISTVSPKTTFHGADDA